MQTISLRILNRVAESTSYNNNYYASRKKNILKKTLK